MPMKMNLVTMKDLQNGEEILQAHCGGQGV